MILFKRAASDLLFILLERCVFTWVLGVVTFQTGTQFLRLGDISDGTTFDILNLCSSKTKHLLLNQLLVLIYAQIRFIIHFIR